MYRTFSHGSEGGVSKAKAYKLLMYSTFSHGSESKYAIAPLVL